MTELNIKVYRDLMGANEKWAQKTRELLGKTDTIMLNLIGSPGSGKTTLLESSVRSLSSTDGARARNRPDGEAFSGLSSGWRFAVLVGDVETTHDAERLAKLNCTVSQLLSGWGCHLEAKMVHYALKDLPLEQIDMVIVENVGNLVCPAEFDLGEHAKVAVLSITEGEDKPAKYPLLFRESKAVILTKLDLLPHLKFDVKSCLNYIHQVNQSLPVLQVSAQTGKGMKKWIQWLKTFEKTCKEGFSKAKE